MTGRPDIIFTPGKENVVADSLSWHTQRIFSPESTPESVALSQGENGIAVAVSGLPLDWAAFKSAQDICPQVKLLAANPRSLLLQHCPVGELSLLCDTSGGRRRPVVPWDWGEKVFSSLHNLAHPGIRASRHLISSRFIWKGLASNVATFCRSCVACQRPKAGRFGWPSPCYIWRPSFYFDCQL